jgi:hypothetical protein
VRSLVVAAAALTALWAAPGAWAAGWCGTGVATADRPDVVTGAQVHAIYATPADGVDNFGAFANALADDTVSIDAWWRGQDASRTPRFDLATFPACTGLDITFARLPQTGAAIASGGSGAFSAIVGSLGSFGYFHPFKRYLVYYDGPSFDPSVCGTASGQFARGPSTAVIWLNACSGGPRDYVAAHELLHSLGALPAGAPHPCSARDSGHVCDSPLDILQPRLSGQPLAAEVLDVNHDDYYGHSGSWPDMQDSIWLRRLDAPPQRLSIVLRGSGRVTSDLPGVDCAAACATGWDTGSLLTLSADGTTRTRFIRWSGACSGVDDCVLTLAGARTVTAIFGPSRIPVRVSTSGRGRVACTPRCSSSFSAGTRLSLRAVAVSGWRFVRWSGACKGTTPVCRPATNYAVSARATFARR